MLVTAITRDTDAVSGVAFADEDVMAKKTVARSRTTPKPAATEPAAAAPTPAPKRTRARAPKKDDIVVAADAAEATGLSATLEPTDEEVRVRAYHRYLERGGVHGMDFEDWLEAKRELMKK